MNTVFLYPQKPPRRPMAVAALVLVTAGAFILAYHRRLFSTELPPLSLAELTGFTFDPLFLGYVTQGVIVPAASLYLLSTTHLFRRVFTDVALAHDRLKLFGLLLLVELLATGLDISHPLLTREPVPVMLGLLVIVAGGLLGGWPAGLALGLIAMLFRGSFDLATAISHGLGRELLTVYQGDGLRGALFLVPWPRIFATHYVFNMYASSPVWAGVAAGLAGHILGGRRFVPMVAMLLGAGTELGAGYLTAIAGVPPGVVFLLPGVVVTSIATTAVALMVRNAQTEAVRRRVQAAELARAQAELRALRAQINPHFLFNALNTIRYFVRADPETARRLLVDLSEVFQRALRSGEFVPLRDELSYVHAYLSLEQARLGERLHVIRPDPTPDLLDRLVPTLILQPIVENAVVHGVARKPGGGTVWIIVEPADGVLLLRVQDDGPGMSPERMAQVLAPREETQTRGRDGKASTSIGLRNVDGRLRSLYGDEFRLDIKSQPGQGTWVQIRIPGEVS